ncbi:cytochrome P450 81Q32-like [Lycium barbarum]|uniref:cytochrome P450 81Q32-like n=1 Tax=Lycium barbarum TaxID=112863 RepID=UPI00293EE686|nr:cytochrome P450 81Q32-like [Lycium barbarum]
MNISMEFSSIYLAIPMFLALYILTQHVLHKLQKLPPCPFPNLPIIGHLYLLKNPMHKNLSKLSKKHGPVLFLQFGSRKVLIVASPSAAEECLSKNDIIFANRPRLIAGKHFGQNYTSLAWSSYGDHWRNLRRIASTQLLSSYRVQTLSVFRTDEVHLMIQHLIQKCKNNDSYQKVDMRSMLFEVTFNSITRMLAGKRFCGERVVDSEEATTFQEIVGELVKVLAKSSKQEFLPFFRWFSLEGIEKMCENAQRKRDVFVQNWIEGFRQMRSNKIEANKENRERTMIEILLSLQETDPEYYTDEMIRGLMMTLLTAASNTSADTMEWTMAHFLNNPEILKKARAEINNVVGQQHLIDESDISQLHYLKSTIMETLRMHPAVPLLLPHESSKDCTIGGFHVPRDTMLLVNVWAIQNNEKIWGDPEVFRPERFEHMEMGKDNGNQFKCLPFGSGRRGCPGENLAMRMIALALGSLIQCFEWERIGDEKEDMSESGGFTAPKARPLVANFRPRPTIVPLLSQT